MVLLLNSIMPTVPVFAETKAELQSAGVCTSVDGTALVNLDESENYNVVSQIDSSCYTTLQAAINAAGDGAVVQLRSNVTNEHISINNKTNLTLDLN